MKTYKYGYDYPMPSITCDVLVFRKCPDSLEEFEVLLIKRKNEPFKDLWAMPGGFMDIDETTIQCAIRELNEETNIIVNENDVRFIKILDDVDRDPRGRVLSHVFCTYVKENIIAKASDDAKELKWFKFNEIPLMAFDHKDVVEKYFPKIR